MGLNLNIGAQSARTVDYNGNGWPDLLICGYTGGLRLFRNNQGQGFTDVSAILGPPVNAVDPVMVDVNHDNRLDLIVLTRTAVTLRLQNADGTFAPPATLLNVKNAVALAVGDINGDNNPDIYVVGGIAGGTNAPDHLLIGDATGGFTTMTIPQTTAGSGEAAFPIDYNHSGLTSFVVLNGAVPHSRPRPTPHARSYLGGTPKARLIRRVYGGQAPWTSVTGRCCAPHESARNAEGTLGCGTAGGAARRTPGTPTGAPPVPAGPGCRHPACGARAGRAAAAARAGPVRTPTAGTRVRTHRTGSPAPRPAPCRAAAARAAGCSMRSYLHGRATVTPTCVPWWLYPSHSARRAIEAVRHVKAESLPWSHGLGCPPAQPKLDPTAVCRLPGVGAAG
jgi:hypothetical protein